MLAAGLAAACATNAVGTITAVATADGNTVAVSGQAAGLPTVAVHSARGIGTATLAVRGGRWPDRISIELFLDGLESLAVVSGKRAGHVEFVSTSEQILVETAPGFLLAPARARNGFVVLVTTAELLPSDTVQLQWVDFLR